MKTQGEVEEFSQKARFATIHRCKKCNGINPDCTCYLQYNTAVQAFEACVPKDFQNIKPGDVKHNVDVFKGIVLKYVEKLNIAIKKGYSLAFLGANGAGKTYFMSYILMEAIRRGRTAYYTTIPQLEFDLKRGWKDKALEQRLEWLLTSDFLALDEAGVERKMRKDNEIAVHIERILKQRCDDNAPVLLSTNLSYKSLLSVYGSAVGSVIDGKFEKVIMESGDYRKKIARKMKKEMGY